MFSALSKKHDVDTFVRGMLSLPTVTVKTVNAYVKKLQSKDNEAVGSARDPIDDTGQAPATMVEITSDPKSVSAPVLEGKRPSFIKRMLDTISNIFVGDVRQMFHEVNTAYKRTYQEQKNFYIVESHRSIKKR